MTVKLIGRSAPEAKPARIKPANNTGKFPGNTQINAPTAYRRFK